MSMIVWAAILDNRYTVHVVRKQPYQGSLEVWENGVQLMQQPVTLTYDARFGVDIGDMEQWTDVACNFVDKRKCLN